MRLSWSQHLQASRMLELADHGHRGMALALMGMSLLILSEDLLASEQILKTEQTLQQVLKNEPSP